LPETIPTRLANPLQGGGVHFESSPGNFTFEKRDGKVIIWLYDQTGCPSLVADY